MNKYVIFFTPRSGSSWLTQMLVDTNLLGKPLEWFNPSHIEENMASLAVNSIDGYLTKIIDTESTNGIFGIELTSIHFEKYLGNEIFLEHFKNDTKYIFLYRHDVIAQAVSLWKAVESNLFHSVEGGKQKDLEFAPEKIKQWTRHILEQEEKLNQIFATLGIKPIKISYEYLVSNPEAAISLIASNLIDARKISLPNSENSYKKLANNNSNTLVSRFYRENHKFCAETFTDRVL